MCFLAFSIPLFYYFGGLEHVGYLTFAFFLINPDHDLTVGEAKAHRSFFTHSLLFPYLTAFALSTIIGAEFNIMLFKYILVPVIIHLILDLRINSNKWRGMYCVSLYPIHKRFNGKVSTLYYILNIIGGILIVWMM